MKLPQRIECKRWLGGHSSQRHCVSLQVRWFLHKNFGLLQKHLGFLYKRVGSSTRTLVPAQILWCLHRCFGASTSTLVPPGVLRLFQNPFGSATNTLVRNGRRPSLLLPDTRSGCRFRRPASALAKRRRLPFLLLKDPRFFRKGEACFFQLVTTKLRPSFDVPNEHKTATCLNT